MKILQLAVFAILTFSATQVCAVPITVFSDDFDGGSTLGAGVTGGWSGGNTSIQGVQGFSGITDGSSTFQGNFKSTYGLPGGVGHPSGEVGGWDRLIFNNLGAHDFINISGLLAIIGNWDASDGGGDYFGVYVNGVGFVLTNTFSANIFNSNNTAGMTDIGGSRVDRGFGASSDQAYDLEALNIAHTGSFLEIDIIGYGDGWGGFTNEAWGLDNLEITMDSSPPPVPEPATMLLLGSGIAGLAGYRRRANKA